MRGLMVLISALLLVLGSISLPVPGLAQGAQFADLLPGYPEGGSTVIVTNEGLRTLDEYAAIFADPREAARLLADWGFHENAFRVYEDTQATESGSRPPYLQVGVTRFENPTGASAALPYIVQNLRPPGAYREIPITSVIGDESRQFVADVEGGTDLTLLVRSGELLIGISTFLADGGPEIRSSAGCRGHHPTSDSAAPTNAREHDLPAVGRRSPPGVRAIRSARLFAARR